MPRMNPWARRANAVRRWLVHPRWPWLVAALGFVLVLPSLTLGFLVDDLLHAHYLRGGDVPGGPRGIWDMYRFADGGPGIQRAIAEGQFVWFTSPQLKFAFFRPISSLWVALDHTLFATRPWVTHLESCLLYGALCGLTAALFRRILPGAVAGLAALLFAVDDAHHFPVLWLANRHSVLSTTFGVLALLAHVKRRQEGGSAWLAPLAFAAALGSGESALGLLPFFLGWGWWMDPAGRRAGVRALAPLLVVLFAWAILYVVGGYGTAASGLYLDPLRQPAAFLQELGVRLPRLLAAQLLFPPADVWPLVPPSAALASSVALLLVLALFGGALARATRGHPAQRFLLFAMVVTLVPACATFPSDRMLLQCSIGASGLVAIALVAAGRRVVAVASETGASWWPRGAGGFALLLTMLHGVLAAPLLPMRVLVTGDVFTVPVARGAASLPDDEALRGQTALILTTPDSLMTTYMFLERLVAGAPVPRRTRALAVSQRGSVRIERESDRALLVTSTVGMYTDAFSLLYREPRWVVGERVVVEDMTAEVLELDVDGFPRRVRFTFDRPITRDEQRWLVWEKHAYVEVPVLAIGEHLDVPSTDWMTAMQP